MTTNEKKAAAKLAERNPMWKGDRVQYGQLHNWIRARIPKPALCQLCCKEPPRDLANKGDYTRDLSNWWWLCRRCHMREDGRLANFVAHTNAGKWGTDNANYRHGKQCRT